MGTAMFPKCGGGPCSRGRSCYPLSLPLRQLCTVSVPIPRRQGTQRLTPRHQASPGQAQAPVIRSARKLLLTPQEGLGE